jgi:hypothetical protein
MESITAPRLPTDLRALMQEVCDSVEAAREGLLRVSRAIHAHPELAFEERQAALLVAALREGGLRVETGAYGLDGVRRRVRQPARPLRCSPNTTRCRARPRLWPQPDRHLRARCHAGARAGSRHCPAACACSALPPRSVAEELMAREGLRRRRCSTDDPPGASIW